MSMHWGDFLLSQVGETHFQSDLHKVVEVGGDGGSGGGGGPDPLIYLRVYVMVNGG